MEAKGMGKGMALKFAEEGCHVAIADISLKDAEETVNEILKREEKAGYRM